GQGSEGRAREVHRGGQNSFGHADAIGFAACDHGVHPRGWSQHCQRQSRGGRELGSFRGRRNRNGRRPVNLSWYVRRLSRMSPTEIGRRLIDARLKRRWRVRQVRSSSADPLPLPASVPAFASVIDPAVGAALPDQARARLLRAADAALAGRFHFFDRERHDLSRDPDWFLDPRTGRRAPDTAYAFDIDCRDVRSVGTVKYVWEPSRHHQLTTVAAANYLTSDDRYAEFVAAQLRSWWRHNPFLSGVHWTSGIELGVRLLSWVWVRRLLASWAPAAALFEHNPDFLRQ